MTESSGDKKFNVDFDAISKLVDLVKKSKVGRIKVSCDGFEIEVESKPQNVVCTTSVDEQRVTVGGETSAVLEEESGNLVVSPIVGTFYSSPAPGKPAFVSVGDVVKKGDVLYIIESMKLMNEVKSDFDGVVTKIFVNSGDPVEYGQSIMLIE